MRARILPLLAVAACLLAACAQGDPNTGPSSDGQSGQPTTCQYNVSGQAAKPVDPPPVADIPTSGLTTVTLRLSQGPVTIELDRGHAPCAVNSFLSLLQQGYYTDTTCHRVTTNGIFVLQCGDPSATGRGGPGYSYADEVYSDDSYPAGTVAMANAGPDTNGSQFFLVYLDSPLNPDYTVLGHMDAASTTLVAGIGAQGTVEGDADGAPKQTVAIEGYSMG
ncbi:MAG: peptidylprolyl isomerase [Propionibacteriaceae bacterium]|nr:peptidylprolyl isomerase [Propionibacteriaceae bacterium]